MLRKQLTANGYGVTIAKDGLDGLMKLEALRPNLIIYDLMMPNLNKLEFMTAIKQHSGTKIIPVIFLTARSDPRTMIDGINVGARFFVTKPFQMDDLLAKVKKALKSP